MVRRRTDNTGPRSIWVPNRSSDVDNEHHPAIPRQCFHALAEVLANDSVMPRSSRRGSNVSAARAATQRRPGSSSPPGPGPDDLTWDGTWRRGPVVVPAPFFQLGPV